MARYIVLVSPSYGGAEKRFFDVYSGLRRRSTDVFYVAPSMLIELLMKDHPERSDVFDGLVPVPLDRWSVATFIFRFARLLRGLPRGSAFHYPMNCLWALHIGRGDKVSMSFVDCKNVPRLFSRSRTTALSYVAFRFATKIDVLNPEIFEQVQASPVGRRATMTPGGTFILPPAAVDLVKQPIATFIGRLISDKGIFDLLRIMPALWRALERRVPATFQLLIAGYGPLEGEVAASVEALRQQGIPITFVGYATAHDIMQRSAVVLSLQQGTNYPSRVVAEALVSGCAVVCRNSGDSSRFGTLPGLVYCRDPLDPADLATAIGTLTLQICGDPVFSREVHSAALTHFYSESYLRYFDSLIAV